MKPYPHLPTVAAIILSATSLMFAQITPEDDYYLKQGTNWAPFVEVAQDEILRFEADVTGDNKAEVFYTKSSLRDGKQGYLWTVYAKEDKGSLALIGELTFSNKVFAPKTWTKDQKTHGFYAFGPGGEGKGILNFYALDGSRLVSLEEREIEPNGADKAEFDGLFAARLKGESPKIDLKRTALPKQQSTTAPSSVVNAPPESRETTPAPKPPPVVQPPTPKKAQESKVTAPSQETKSSTPWSIIVVLILHALGLLWLLLKRRS
jgi:hypothetical protein